jgi:hypothetical protein
MVERRKEKALTARRKRAIMRPMNGFSVRRFCFRHLLSIFAVCMIATSSYVFFDLLDIDGSRFKDLAQICSLEAVMPDASGEIKSPTAHTPAPSPGFLRDLLFAATSSSALVSRPALPLTYHYHIVHTRNATQSESASYGGGIEPAQRFV